MSDWAALEARLSGACDAAFGEDFSFTPMVAGTLSSAAPDASRAAVPRLTGIWSAGFLRPTAHPVTPRENTVGTRADFIGASGQEFCVNAAIADIGGVPKREDRFTRIATAETYRVWDVQLDGQSRVDCYLERLAP